MSINNHIILYDNLKIMQPKSLKHKYFDNYLQYQSDLSLDLFPLNIKNYV